MSKLVKIPAGSPQKKQANQKEQFTPQQTQDGQNSKNEQKKFIQDGQGILPPSESLISQSNQNSDEEETLEIEVKEKGFQNYFENYYTRSNGDTIFKNYYKPDVLTKELKKNKIKISDLSVTKYYSSIIKRDDDDNGNSFFNGNYNSSQIFKNASTGRNNLGAIFTLPRIKYSEIEQNEQHIKQGISKVGSGFVSFQKIKDMNGILLQTFEQDYCEGEKSLPTNPSQLIKQMKDLFMNKNQNNKQCFFSTKSFLEKSFSQAGDKSSIKNNYYTNKEKLEYTLQHNKFNENQLKELDQTEQMKSLQKLQNIIDNQSKIMMKQHYRKYPSAQPSINHKLPFFGSINLSLQKTEEENEQKAKQQISTEKEIQLQIEKQFEYKNPKNTSLKSQQSRISFRTLGSQDKSQFNKKRTSKQVAFKQKKPEKQNNLANFYPCFVIKNEEILWKPEVRELFKIAYNGETVFLFGGCSSKPMSDMSTFSIASNKWNQVNSLNEEDGRYNHMMGMYKKNVVIFGGEKLEGQYEQKQKVCVNDTRIFYPEKNEWKYMRPTGDIIEPRRNASSCIVGRYLIIQGGISSKGTFLNDLWVLDIMNHRWNSGQCEDRNNFMQEGRAFHKSCPVFHVERKQVDLFKEFVEKSTEKQHNDIKQEGVYFFGGQSQSGEANNQLTLLVTNTRPMHFLQPETLGKKPEPRYNHSLTFNQKLKMLVIYGGMDENLQSESSFLDDLFILQLSDMQWFECATLGSGIQRRANHEAVCYDTQILIFGGIGDNGYFSFESYKLELDKKKSKQYIIDLKMKQKEQEIQSLKRAKTIKGNANSTSEKRNEKVLEHENFIKQLQSEQDGLKTLVEKLNYKNYKSFLPLPVIFKRKKSNLSNSIAAVAEKQKKDELDQEVNEHIEVERKLNESYFRQNSNSPISSRPSSPKRKNSIHHAQTVNIQDQKVLPLIKSNSEIGKKQNHFKIALQLAADQNILQLPK